MTPRAASMAEGRAILALAARLGSDDGALATVVGLQGSGYRRAGARLLASRDGMLAGGVSGGCLETDVLEHARMVMTTRLPHLAVYDTTDPTDELLGVGLGCRGVAHIWIEPLASEGCQAFLAAWHDVMAGGLPVTQAVVVAGEPGAPPGARLIRQGGRERYADCPDPGTRAALEAAAQGPGGLLPAGHGLIAYVEHLQPPAEVWICGAGLDAPAMAALAVQQGHRVTVFDHRPAYAREERFAREVPVALCRPGRLPPELADARPTAALVMCHHYPSDRAWLGAMLAREPAYVGLLGPRRRAERLLAELRDEGLALPAWPACLHAPVGLDIGAETPEEVALAAMAELRAVLAGRTGGFLRERSAPIHVNGPV